ncbi:MAG: hypothetical protein JW864_16415 [Spirochaetes bacterium]|nr:hypothetical protein [Spirochaetota bacterium]
MKRYFRIIFTCVFFICISLTVLSCSYFKMAFNNEKDDILDKLSPFHRHDNPGQQDYSNLEPRYTSEYNNLNDSIFKSKYGEQGLFLPEKFLKKIKYNFYLLDKDSEDKMPVIFVHGAGGTPADWKYFVNNIDKNKFAPIVFYYPTGIRLKNSAGLLHKAIKEIYNYHGKIILVAHSMGGLVCRGAIRCLIEDNLCNHISLYVSFSTPYGGLKQAQDGIEHLPDYAVVPSWKDVATKSVYLKELYFPVIPSETDFRLFFGYRNPKKFRIGPNSDGTITMNSQLDFRAQNEAKRIYGFNDDHESILKKKDVFKALNELLIQTSNSIKENEKV